MSDVAKLDPADLQRLAMTARQVLRIDRDGEGATSSITYAYNQLIEIVSDLGAEYADEPVILEREHVIEAWARVKVALLVDSDGQAPTEELTDAYEQVAAVLGRILDHYTLRQQSSKDNHNG
jgi:hypothetical protein